MTTITIKMNREALIAEIAEAYVANVIDAIKKHEWMKIANGRAAPGDFCDDNMLMRDAMVSCGITMDGDVDDIVVDLWNAAYDQALRHIRAN